MTKLRIDNTLSAGGGFICLGYALLGFISQDRYEQFPSFSYPPSFATVLDMAGVPDATALTQGRVAAANVYDIIRSPLNDELYDLFGGDPSLLAALGVVVDTMPSNKFDPGSGSFFSNDTYYSEGPAYERGLVGNYSSPFNPFCNNLLVALLDQPAGGRFPANRTGIITDGLCGSTCAMFVKTAKRNQDAVLFSVGGIDGDTDIEIGSFAGGRVIEHTVSSHQSMSRTHLRLHSSCTRLLAT